MHDSGNVLIPIPIPDLLWKPDSNSDSRLTLKADFRPKFSDSDSNSDSRSFPNVWFRFWFRFQELPKRLIPIPVTSGIIPKLAGGDHFWDNLDRNWGSLGNRKGQGQPPGHWLLGHCVEWSGGHAALSSIWLILLSAKSEVECTQTLGQQDIVSPYFSPWETCLYTSH